MCIIKYARDVLRPLSRRIPPPLPPAKNVSRLCRWKKFGVLPGQLKFPGAAAIAFFSARHGAIQLNATTCCHYYT